MKKVLKFLKPYWWLALLCVALVGVQAMSDLKLPDYMSDIVNTGVMSYGIEDAVPEKISRATMTKLSAFMPQEASGLVSSYYTGVTADTQAQAILEYRVPEEISRAQAKEDRAAMDAAFGEGFMVLSALEQMSGLTAEDVAALPQSMKESIPQEMLTLMAQGVNMVELAAQLPQAQRQALAQTVTAQYAAMGDSVAGQVASLALQAEYAAIGVDLSAIQRASIFKTGGKMLLVALLVLVSAVGATLLSSRISAGLARDIRLQLFEKVTTFSSAEINRFSTASLITRTSNDVQQVQQVVTMMLRMMIYAPIMGVGGIIYAVEKSSSMSWIIVLAVLVLLGVMALLFAFVMPKFKVLQRLVDRLNLVTRENVSGTMVSRAYNTQDFEAQRFDEANQALAKTNLFVQRAMVVMMPFINLIMSGLMLLIIWFGAKEISNAAMQVGDMMAYMQYAMHVVMSFMFVAMMFIMLPRAAVSAERIAEVLEAKNSIEDPQNPVQPATDAATRGLIEFSDVSFRYPGAEKNALTGITFTARPGEMTAVIGATGSGKSSLMNLILRFYDVSGGSVKVGGQNVRDMTQHDLRALLGYVPQKSVLFTGTIAENISFGDPQMDTARIEAAAGTAQASSFIAEKEDGFGEAIAQGGTNVSGGQRQRLSIARALATDAPILLFDDSFSALDFKTDAQLRRALSQQAAQATLFVVAQRVGTIMNAQQIIVLDEGRIVGLGTHQELMETCAVYQDIAKSQLKEDELHG